MTIDGAVLSSTQVIGSGTIFVSDGGAAIGTTVQGMVPATVWSSARHW